MLNEIEKRFKEQIERVCNRFIATVCTPEVMQSVKSQMLLQIQQITHEINAQLGCVDDVVWLLDPQCQTLVPCIGKSLRITETETMELNCEAQIAPLEVVLKYCTVEELLTSPSELLRWLGKKAMPLESVDVSIHIEKEKA